MSQQEFDTLKKQLATSRQEFDTLKEQLARSRQETATVKSEVDSWQNSTILILKQYLIENPSKQIWNNMCFDHEIVFNLHPTGRPMVRIFCIEMPCYTSTDTYLHVKKLQKNCHKLTVTAPHILWLRT